MNKPVKVILGHQYDPTMWDLRKGVAAARMARQGLVFVTITAPGVARPIGAAIESGSLYLVGIQTAQGSWFEFAPDTGQSSPGVSESKQRLQNSRWIMATMLSKNWPLRQKLASRYGMKR